MQRVTISSTRYHSSYHTFSLSLTWIGDNSTCHYNFNLLPHTLTYIFFRCSMVWGYLQCVTTCYRQVYKKNILIFSFKKRWQRVANSRKPGKYQIKYMVMRVLTHVGTRSSYGNRLH